MNAVGAAGLLIVIVSGLIVIDVIWDWLRHGDDRFERDDHHTQLMREIRRHSS